MASNRTRSRRDGILGWRCRRGLADANHVVELSHRIVPNGSGFGLHEVYYDSDELPWAMTDRPLSFACGDDRPNGVRQSLLMAAVTMRTRSSGIGRVARADSMRKLADINFIGPIALPLISAAFALWMNFVVKAPGKWDGATVLKICRDGTPILRQTDSTVWARQNSLHAWRVQNEQTVCEP